MDVISVTKKSVMAKFILHSEAVCHITYQNLFSSSIMNLFKTDKELLFGK